MRGSDNSRIGQYLRRSGGGEGRNVDDFSSAFFTALDGDGGEGDSKEFGEEPAKSVVGFSIHRWGIERHFQRLSMETDEGAFAGARLNVNTQPDSPGRLR